MKDFKYEDVVNDKLGRGKKLTISLTNEYSHEVFIEPGQGSFVIGNKGINSDEYTDVLVNKDDKIYWNSFNNCEKIFGQTISPSIKWPRFFSYSGNDIGFIEWSRKRNIEEFTWKPQKEMKVDFTNANIHRLFIKTDNKLVLSFGSNIDYLDLYGDPKKYVIEKCLKTPSLGFYPKYDDTKKIIDLPNFDCLHDTKELLIEVDPNGAPFDCKSILQFPNLQLLHLIGNVTNLSVLKELKHLNKLGFWNVPDLANLPNLDTWKELKKFVAINIDENVGKRLKEEIRNLKKNEQYEDLYVSKLRNKIWFETEYGSPFANWNHKMEKRATSIYKKCLRSIKAAKNRVDIQNSIIEYTNSFNKISNIETVERDDIYMGLVTIMKNSPVNIEYDAWFKWFDEIRDF